MTTTTLTRRQQAAVARILAAFPAPPGAMPEYGVIDAMAALLLTVEPHDRDFVMTGVHLTTGVR